MGASEPFDDRFEQLPDGPLVPQAVYLLLARLGGRGFEVRRDGDRLVVQAPEQTAAQRDAGQAPDRLTEQDCIEITKWKYHLLLMVDWWTRPNHDAHLFTDTAAAPSSRSVA